VTVARALEAVLGPDLPIAVRAYDGSRLGPADAPATLLVRSPAVFRRLVTAPGELGLGRAYVSGELDVEGDQYAAVAALRDRIPDLRAFGARQWAEVLRIAGSSLAPAEPPILISVSARDRVVRVPA
jgi:cyclopropane-fatty-acyl-phospholipid synthase